MSAAVPVSNLNGICTIHTASEELVLAAVQQAAEWPKLNLILTLLTHDAIIWSMGLYAAAVVNCT